MATKKIADRAEAQFRGLAADLSLLEQLQKVRSEISALDDKCTFVEEVYGRDHKAYRKAHVERDQLLLSADKLVQRWLKERAGGPVADA